MKVSFLEQSDLFCEENPLKLTNWSVVKFGSSQDCCAFHSETVIFFKLIFILLFYSFKHGLAATGVICLMNEHWNFKKTMCVLIWYLIFFAAPRAQWVLRVLCVCASLCMGFFFFFLNQCVVKNKTNPPPINKLCLSTVILFDQNKRKKKTIELTWLEMDWLKDQNSSVHYIKERLQLVQS